MAILPGGDPAGYTLDNIISWLQGSVLDILLVLVAGVAVIMIIYGGYMYLTAFGNEEQAEKGKKTIFWTVVGLAIVILARLFISTVKGILGA